MLQIHITLDINLHLRIFLFVYILDVFFTLVNDCKLGTTAV